MSIYPSGEKSKGQDSKKPDNESFLYSDANLLSDLIEDLQSGKISSIQEGINISIDNTNPLNPIISATGVLGVNSVAGISVDNTDPANPIVNATINSTDAVLLNRANHTGTQTASTISDFDSAVSSSPNVALNTANRINKTSSNTIGTNFSLIDSDGYGSQNGTESYKTGKVSVSNQSYWETYNDGGVTKTRLVSNDGELPETDADYTSGITPASNANKLITYKAVNPVNLEITAANDTLDINYFNSNGDIHYNNVIGGNLTIEDDFLGVNQVVLIWIENTGVPSFLAGAGVTLSNKYGNFTGEAQYGNVLIKKTSAGNYNLAGDLIF